MKIKEKTINLPPAEGAESGLTIYPYIFYFCKDKPSQRLRDHEWVHILQVRDQGWPGFYSRYLWGLRKGYRSVEAEREAYNVDADPELLKRVRAAQEANR